MVGFREFLFPVALEWPGGRRVVAHAEGKPPVEIATPPEFRDGIEGVWSPEDLLVAATASCFMVTFVAAAARRELELADLEVEAVGRLGRRDDGTFGFTAIDLRVEIETAPGQVEEMHEAARAAESGCLVAAALSVPVELDLRVHATVKPPVAA